jgi:hypothetical protein
MTPTPNIQAEMMKTTTTHPATALRLRAINAFLPGSLSDGLAMHLWPFLLKLDEFDQAPILMAS